MELMKGYKRTEVGVIPESWEVKCLGELGKFYKGKGIKKDEVKGQGIPCIRYGELYTLYDNVITKVSSFIDPIVTEVSFPLRYGDLIFAGSGETKEEIGKSAVVLMEGVYAGGDIVVLRSENVDHYFLGYLSNSKIVNTQKFICGQGDAVVHIYANGIGNIKIPLPPLPEQKAIARVLSDTDTLIQTLQNKINKKRDIKQGAMQQLLKPKEGWERKKLGEIGSFKNGINKSSDQFGYGFPFVNLLDVFGCNELGDSKGLGLLNSNHGDRQMYNLVEGDVLFIRSSVKPSGVGLTCLIHCDIQDTVYSGFMIRYRSNESLETSFKKYCFSSSYFRKSLIASSTVSANTNINQNALSDLVLYYPKSTIKQSEIATILSDMDSEIEQLQEKLSKYQKIKQGLMQNLLTGKIRLV